jgi:hypothetical protein
LVHSKFIIQLEIPERELRLNVRRGKRHGLTKETGTARILILTPPSYPLKNPAASIFQKKWSMAASTF